MAGEMVASALLDIVLEKLVSGALKEFGLLCCVKEDLNKLESKLSTIKAMLEVAEKQVVVEKALHDWLLKLKYAAYDADDLLVEFHTEIHASINRRVLQFFSLSNPIIFRLKIAHKIKEARVRIDDIAAEKDKFPLNTYNIQNTDMEIGNLETFSGIEEVCGRDEDREAIMSLLLNTSTTEKISIIPIVGMGGLGKTTLAQLVYNDERVKGKYSNLRMWVYVSRDFDLKNICRVSIEQATNRTCDLKAMETLNTQLKEELSNKRFLLVLDDLWNTEQRDLDTLKLLFSNGMEGSKIIVTTRDMEVALRMGAALSSIHELKGLSDGDCLTLFKKRAFARGDEDPDLVAIGEEIIQKCGGVPLAVNTLASMLYLKGRESWEVIRDSDIWKQNENGDHVLTSLRLTYTNLPSRLKQCFAYCSIFPKGYEIDRDLLIAQWTAQGFISSSGGGMQVEETGKEYFNKLLWVSFLQYHKEFQARATVTFKMHDLVHDLAQSIAGDEVSNIHEVSARLTKHCRYACSLVDFNEIPHRDIPKKLRALRFHPSSNLVIPKKSCWRFKCLRALSTSCSSLLSFSIPKLHNLRYLEVSDLQGALPESICGLGNLQTLCLNDCGNSNPLPECIDKLQNLRILILSRCRVVEHLPESIGNLKSLSTLNLSGCDQLKALPHSIHNLQNLQILNLFECSELEALPDSVCDLENLLTLNLAYLGKLKRLPESIGSLGMLRSLDLSYCESLEKLPESIGSLGMLRSLDLSDCESLEKLPESIGSLGRLRSLDLSFCELLEVLPQSTAHLTSLKSLKLSCCKKLRELPQSIGDLTSLKSLQLLFCEKLQELPQSISGLRSLDSLGLHFTGLRELPAGLGSMTSLRHLDIEYCDRIMGMPPQMGQLTKLQTLSNFVVGKPSGYSSIAELEHLRLLEGELRIDGLENVESPSDARRANLKGKQRLRELTLSWGDDAADYREEEAVYIMESLQPPQSIERLDLIRYRGASLPEWIVDLASLTSLGIWFCCRLTALPEGLKGLTRLESLVIRGASSSLADRCEREQGEDWHKIAHIPVIEIRTD